MIVPRAVSGITKQSKPLALSRRTGQLVVIRSCVQANLQLVIKGKARWTVVKMPFAIDAEAEDIACRAVRTWGWSIIVLALNASHPADQSVGIEVGSFRAFPDLKVLIFAHAKLVHFCGHRTFADLVIGTAGSVCRYAGLDSFVKVVIIWTGFSSCIQSELQITAVPQPFSRLKQQKS